MADLTAIPAELLARLDALKGALCTNGTVRCRDEPGRRTTWRLRYRDKGRDGKWRQFALSLRDERVALAVAILVAAWQQQYREHVQLVRQAEQTRKDQRRRQRQRRRIVQDLGGGGWRRRRNIGRAYDQAVRRGPQEELAFVIGERYLQPNRRPGRPAKSGLVLLV